MTEIDIRECHLKRLDEISKQRYDGRLSREEMVVLLINTAYEKVVGTVGESGLDDRDWVDGPDSESEGDGHDGDSPGNDSQMKTQCGETVERVETPMVTMGLGSE